MPIDVWLDNWEMEIGQSLTDEISKAMEVSKFIAIVITENYNTTVWTKTEYKKAMAREQKENRTVMLPLIIGEANIPSFLEDKIYIDLRTDFFSGIFKLVGMVHNISAFRISEFLNYSSPKNVEDVWTALESVGFSPYMVLGRDDFDEVLKAGGELIEENYASFDPIRVARDPKASSHIRRLLSHFAAS